MGLFSAREGIWGAQKEQGANCFFKGNFEESIGKSRSSDAQSCRQVNIRSVGGRTPLPLRKDIQCRTETTYPA